MFCGFLVIPQANNAWHYRYEGYGDICVPVHLANRSSFGDYIFAITYSIIVLFANYPCGELHIYNEDRLSRAAKLLTHSLVSGLYLCAMFSLW